MVVLDTCLNKGEEETTRERRRLQGRGGDYKGEEETTRRLCLLHLLLAIMRFLASTPLLLLLHVRSMQHKHTLETRYRCGDVWI